MGISAEAYARQLKALLPQGAAFNEQLGTVLSKVFLAVADELARIDARGGNLIDEVDPASTIELLGEWETAWGLPDPCITDTQTLQQRRAALVSRVTGLGGQSRAYFIALAAALGYTITITEFRPFRAGASEAGDPLSNGDWAHTWQVNAPETTITYFSAGRSPAGEPLRDWGNEELECAIGHRKPAHTIAIFAYS